MADDDDVSPGALSLDQVAARPGRSDATTPGGSDVPVVVTTIQPDDATPDDASPDDKPDHDEDLTDAVVVSHDNAPPLVTILPRKAPVGAADVDGTATSPGAAAPEPEATNGVHPGDPAAVVTEQVDPAPIITEQVDPAPIVTEQVDPGPVAAVPDDDQPLPEPARAQQPEQPDPVLVAATDVTPGPDAEGRDPGDNGYGYTYPPTPEQATLRPSAHMIRAHRHRERRRTLTFLGIFLGVLGMGLASFTFFQGAWSWPFGASQAAAPVACPIPTQTAPPATDVTVKVYNASSRKGLARTVSATLKERGFEIGEVGNDPQESKVPGIAVIRHGPGGRDAAETVAAYVQGSVTFVADERVSQSVDLVLGREFTKIASAAAAAKVLTPPLVAAPAGCTPAPADQTPTPSAT